MRGRPGGGRFTARSMFTLSLRRQVRYPTGGEPPSAKGRVNHGPLCLRWYRE